MNETQWTVLLVAAVAALWLPTVGTLVVRMWVVAFYVARARARAINEPWVREFVRRAKHGEEQA